jgi:hypothetical protein
MLVMLTDNQLLSPQAVCPGCLMADRSGRPRWQNGQLQCGRAVDTVGTESSHQYECQMGFRIADIH